MAEFLAKSAFTASIAAIDTAKTDAENHAQAIASFTDSGSTSFDKGAKGWSIDAETAKTAAEAAQTAAEAANTSAQSALTQVQTIFDNFDDRYLGEKASDPTEDNDGDPLQAGQVYWNTTDDELKFYNGATWEAPSTQAATSATNALASENKAADWAEEDEDVEVETGQYSAKHHSLKASASSTAAGTAQSASETAQTAAETARDKAADWAEEDEDVEVETGQYSAKHWSAKAEGHSDVAAAYANFEGVWTELTGALNVPAAVFHDSMIWMLLDNLADVTTSEPSPTNTDWALLTERKLNALGVLDSYAYAEWTVGSGESSLDIAFSGEVIVFRNGTQLPATEYSQAGDVLTINFELASDDDPVTVLKLTEAELGALTDVDVTDAADGDILMRVGGNWVKKSQPNIPALGWTDLRRYDLMDNFERASLSDTPTGQTWAVYDKGGNSDTLTVENGTVHSNTGSAEVTDENLLILAPVGTFSTYASKYSRIIHAKHGVGITFQTSSGIVFAQDENNYIEVVKKGSNYGIDVIVSNVRTENVYTWSSPARYYSINLTLSLLRNSANSQLFLAVNDYTNAHLGNYDLSAYFSDFSSFGLIGAHLRWDDRASLAYIASESNETRLTGAPL